MKRKLDLEQWKRKEHYEFFIGMSDPIYTISANVKCTSALKWAKENKRSFFIKYLFESLRAVNEVENLRMRIEDNEVWIYDKINGSSTIGREDETFGFSFFDFDHDYDRFEEKCNIDIERVQKCSGLGITKDTARLDVIHYSAIPWIKFTSVNPQSHNDVIDSIPKIYFGKYFEENGEFYLPVALAAHHALVDGIHMGKYFEKFTEYMS